MRLRRADRQLGEDGGEPYRYLAIYEVDGDDLARAVESLSGGVDSGMVISEALDMERTDAWLFTAITDRLQAGE